MRISCFLVVVAFGATLLRQVHATDAHAGAHAVAGQTLLAKQMQLTSPSSQYDVLPKFISGFAPTYPLSRVRRGEPGYALIEFTVDETGKTRDCRVIKMSYSYFGSHAILAIQQWRFRPALKHNRPVSCRVRIPFVYTAGTQDPDSTLRF